MNKKSCIFAPSNSENVPVAQLVEQLTLNQWVQGSNPCGDTKTALTGGFFISHNLNFSFCFSATATLQSSCRCRAGC